MHINLHRLIMGDKNGVDPEEEDDSPSLPVMVIGKEKVDVRTFKEKKGDVLFLVNTIIYES
jgi:hypothetical protein